MHEGATTVRLVGRLCGAHLVFPGFMRIRILHDPRGTLLFHFMTETLSKETIRDQAKFHRDRIEVLPEMGEQAAAQFAAFLKEIDKNKIIAGYWPKDKEFDVRPCLDEAMQAGFQICLPKTNGKAEPLDFISWDGQEVLTPGKHGIMEPPGENSVDPDVLLIPLLAFDRRGYRMGYGGGHYDSTLQSLRAQKDILAIGVGYAAQAVLFNLPIEEHDQKLDYILTENELRKTD